MVRAYVLLLLLCFSTACFAHHVKGGYIHYEYQGAGSTAGTSVYKVTVTMFFGCGVQGPRSPLTLYVLDGSTGSTLYTTSISTATSTTATKTTFSSCMSNPPTICYEIYTYNTTYTLTDNASGYVLALTDEYRTDNIINIANSSSTGIAITAQIPGTINNTDYHKNTSPVFAFKDTAIICYKGTFNYQFSASDPTDNDSLSYSFGNGLNVTSSATSPFFASLTYNSGYSGTSPMGNGVTIDAKTGLISGTAPSTTGEYVIAVYVHEWRNGVEIDAIKKELQIYVYDCSLTAAELSTSYINCNNYTFTFENESSASNVTSYLWDFGVTTSTKDTSSQPTPTYTYADTGTYTVKLKVSNSTGCTDSASSPVKVYPGFSPGFTVSGSCYQSPFIFTDTSYVKYGSVNAWSWNFGDLSTTADTSSKQNPTYQYSSPGTVTVTLNITSSKGCSGTATKTVAVNGKPDIYLPFTDTLICSIDSLTLIVKSTDGTGFSWSPQYNIINPNTANPTVYPKDTTVYTVTVTDKGCIDSASVTVNVLDYITVKLPADTAICSGDTITLSPVSYALSYLWSNSQGNSLSSDSIKNPDAFPSQTTTYYVTANLGHCQDHASEIVYVSPYPQVSVSADTSVCYGNTAQLHATTSAAYFTWTPTSTLLNETTLNPVAGPMQTTNYIIAVKDSFYCPKTVYDTITVTVIPTVTVFAGNDTSVVLNQPLQLNATSNNSTVSYAWSPSSYMSNTAIYNPVVTITSSSVDSIIYLVKATTPEGCAGTDSIKVIVYKTAPDIFVPSAFTPNSDGLNDVLKPTLVGIEQFEFFRVYNRWGQLIYSTSVAGNGWDGTIGGQKQPPATFVYMARGKDYNGKTIFKKGTVVLIR
jgi:gliding motility-associated-like protein